jgi:hypothetical protein
MPDKSWTWKNDFVTDIIGKAVFNFGSVTKDTPTLSGRVPGVERRNTDQVQAFIPLLESTIHEQVDGWSSRIS